MGQEFRIYGQKYGTSGPYLIYAQCQQVADAEFWVRSPLYCDNPPPQRLHEKGISYQENWFATEEEATNFILDAFAILVEKGNLQCWNGSIKIEFQDVEYFDCHIPHAWSTKALVGMAKARYFEVSNKIPVI